VNNKDEMLFAVLAVNKGTQPVYKYAIYYGCLSLNAMFLESFYSYYLSNVKQISTNIARIKWNTSYIRLWHYDLNVSHEYIYEKQYFNLLYV